MYPTFQSGSVGGAQKPLYTDAQKKTRNIKLCGWWWWRMQPQLIVINRGGLEGFTYIRVFKLLIKIATRIFRDL